MASENNPSPHPQQTPPLQTDPEPELRPPILEDEQLPQPPQLKKSRKGLIIAVVVILVLVAGAATWYFLMRGKPATTNPQTVPTAPDETSTTDDVPPAENSETFTSSPYRTTFQHPKTWTVTENNDNSILVQSEDFTYKTVDGQSKNGNFRVYIRKGGQQADSDIIAKGVAIEPSSKLVYKKPTAAQRADTNLSLFGLNNENNFAFLLITSNFSLKKGDGLGPNFGKEIEAIIVGGGFSEPSLEPGLATNPVPVNGFKDSNAYKQAIAIIETLEIL